MTPLQLEALTLRTIDQIREGQPVEDSQIELKRMWPADPYKAARRIGGHANASRGQSIVWIIGVDEREGVTGADAAELSDWWPQVQRYFDGIPPELALSLNVPVDGNTVAVLAFDTTRFPFVVTNGSGKGGPIQREVPYRSGTGVRSAKREDLIRLMQPTIPVPRLEVLYAMVKGSELEKPQTHLADDVPEGDSRYDWEVEVTLYAVLGSQSAAVLPVHTSELEIVLGDGTRFVVDEQRLGYSTAHGSTTAETSAGDMILLTHGRFRVWGRYSLPTPGSRSHEPIRVRYRTLPVGAPNPITVEAELEYRMPWIETNRFPKREGNVWTAGKTPW